MRVNFAGTDVPDFSPIPTGTYHCAVTGGEVRDTQAGVTEKNPTGQYISWELTVQDGEFQGRKVWTNTPLGGTGVGFLKGLLWAAGQMDKNYDGDLDFEIDDVLGNHVLARVTVDTNRDSNNVKNLRPYSDAEQPGSLQPA